MSDQLTTCTHVFVRHDAVRKPLRPPYDGPYLVFERHAKYFLLDIDSRRKSVSIDRLKLAHMEMSSTDAVASLSTDSSKTPNPPSTPTQLATPIPPVTSNPSVDISSRASPRMTHSGQWVHWPKRLASYVPWHSHWDGSTVVYRNILIHAHSYVIVFHPPFLLYQLIFMFSSVIIWLIHRSNLLLVIRSRVRTIASYFTRVIVVVSLLVGLSVCHTLILEITNN